LCAVSFPWRPMTNLNYQGIGLRLAAQIIDAIILSIIFFIIGFGMSGSFTFSYENEAAYPIIALNALIDFLYFIVLEGTSGATLGKRLVKIKVVRENGSPCGIGPSFVRNILRIIDELPGLHIIGMIWISRSDKKQRLGDRIGKTVVVKA
jgi:uncharacterized RDD family membrane protein YckC